MIKFKALHPNAVLPSRVHIFDAGLDLTAVSMTESDLFIEYDTGIAVAIPEGYVGLVVPRSSVTKTGMMLGNSVGIIDSQYTGPIKIRYKVLDDDSRPYSPGDRIAQLVVVPILLDDGMFVDELPVSLRGSGGFGSTGV